MGCRHHDVGVGRVTGIEHTIGPQPDGYLPHGIDPLSDGFDTELHQLIRHLGQAVEGLADRIHRTGADRRLAALLSVRRFEGDGGRGQQTGAAAHLHAPQQKAGFALLLHLLTHDRFEIAVGDLPFAIGQFLEAHEGIVEIFAIEAVAELLEAGAEGTAAGELAQGDAVVAQADGAGINDLVGETVLEHAILVNARFVGKGIGPHDRLIGLHRHAGEIRHQPRGFGDLLGVHRREWCGALGRTAQKGVVVAAAHMQRHHQLFERSIAGPLTDAIDGAFQLAGTIFDRLKKVGHRQAEVVMAVHRNHGLIDIGNTAIDAGDQLTELRGCGIAHCVGNVDRGGTGFDGGLDHLMHVVGITAAGVLAGELNIVDERAGIGDHLAGDGEHLSAGFAQLVLEVDVAGGDEGVDAAVGGGGHSLGAGFDVAPGSAGQAADHRAIGGADAGGDALHGVEIAAAGEGETGLDDVHPQTGQLLGDRQLFLQVETGAGRLLAVAQRGVEDQNPTGIARHDRRQGVRRNEYELAAF